MFATKGCMFSTTPNAFAMPCDHEMGREKMGRVWTYIFSFDINHGEEMEIRDGNQRWKLSL